MSGVASGKLRHWAELQDKQDTQDPDTLEIITDWVTIASVWCDIQPLSAREFLAAAAEQSEVRAKIILRHREIKPTMRFVYRGKAYRVIGSMEDNESMREHVTCMVAEGVRVD
jgi:SPP1 family predicted phage head-tail adaptor